MPSRMKRHWFLPESPDVLGLLAQQTSVTMQGVEAFVAWSSGDLGQDHALRVADHEARRLRRELQSALHDVFSAPLEPLDLQEISERLDAILAGARSVVREAILAELAPDPPLATMAGQMAEAVRHLGAAVEGSASDPARAAQEAHAAVQWAEEVGRSYCDAVSALVEVADLDDLHHSLGRHELYRQCADLGEVVIRAAERTRFAVAGVQRTGSRVPRRRP